MSNTLDRSPLESLAGLTRGRQVKLGAAIADARERHMDATPLYHTTVEQCSADLNWTSV